MKIINNKIFKLIVAIYILGIIIGIFLYYKIDMTSIKSDISNYFNMIKNNNLLYYKSLIKTIIDNYKYILIIWSSGILLIGIIIIPLLIIFKGISTFLLIFSIIIDYKLKGLILALILLLPILINMFIYILMSYYSLNITFKLLNFIKNNREINIKTFFKNYFIILIILLFVLLLSSLLEVFICSNLIKFIV